MAFPSLRGIDLSAVPSSFGVVGVASAGVPGSCRRRSLIGVSINVRFGRGPIRQQAPGCVSLCPTTRCRHCAPVIAQMRMQSWRFGLPHPPLRRLLAPIATRRPWASAPCACWRRCSRGRILASLRGDGLDTYASASSPLSVSHRWASPVQPALGALHVLRHERDDARWQKL